jgi:hypothetical protein
MVLPDLLATDPFAPSARQAAIIGILALIVLYAYWYSRRKAKGGKWPKVARSESETVSFDAVARKDLTKLVQQLDDLSKQVENRLDAKCAALEQSIHNADQRITALSTLLKVARSAGVQLESAGTDSGSASPSLKSAFDQGGLRASSLPEDRTRRIYELADNGRSASQIAQETQQRVGEIELILNLRRSATAASA